MNGIFLFNHERNPADNREESWPCRQDVKLTSPFTHSAVTYAENMHNSVISLQTSSAKEQVAIDLDLNRISADLYGTQEMVKVCKQEAF